MSLATVKAAPDAYAVEPTEKYLFLDFDGPMHPTTTLQGKNVALLASSPSALREAGFFVWADALEQLLAQAEAAAMLEGLYGLGFDLVVATPHMRPGMFENDKGALERAYAATVSQIASKLAKPAAFNEVPAGLEIPFLHPLSSRWLPGVGPVVWGARTLAGRDTLASQWKYLPVRRVAVVKIRVIRIPGI